MIDIALPAEMPDLPEPALCFLAALKILDTEPKDLSPTEIDESIDKVRKVFTLKKLLTTLYPCHVHNIHTQQMHQKIFCHLIQFLNPLDLTKIYELNLSHLWSEFNITVQIKFQRDNRKYSYDFTLKYSSNFVLKIIMKNSQEKPIRLPEVRKVQYRRTSSHTTAHRRTPSIHGTPIPAINPIPAPPSYQQHLATAHAPTKRWNLNAIPQATRIFWTVHIQHGTTPHNLQDIHDMYIAAVNQRDPNHELLGKICRKDHPSMRDVDELMRDLTLMFQNKIVGAFGMSV